MYFAYFVTMNKNKLILNSVKPTQRNNDASSKCKCLIYLVLITSEEKKKDTR